jgi:hypothetical protein
VISLTRGRVRASPRGERDVRRHPYFTPYAEANTAEDTVARLNALFKIVVPAVVEVPGVSLT